MKAKINRDAFLSISGVFLALNTPKNSLKKSSTVFESGNLHVVERQREHAFRTDISVWECLGMHSTHPYHGQS